jgi:hypothetical protein
VALTAFDGNKKLLLLAAVEAVSENSQAIMLMLHCANRIAAGLDWNWNQPAIVFTSDRSAAIKFALRTLFPAASHMYCVVHLLRDCVKKNFNRRPLTPRQPLRASFGPCRVPPRYSNLRGSLLPRMHSLKLLSNSSGPSSTLTGATFLSLVCEPAAAAASMESS